jgi:trans-aconitate methyltransferase
MLKMYSELASWWPLLSPPRDYEEEAEFFIGLLQYAQLPQNAIMLELGSGGGSNALYLKEHFAQTTLTDFSPEMLAVSKALNPECEHIEGDMRTLRLGRTFDFVFVHDAIEYMTTREDLAAAIVTAAVHCRPGGTALFVPDWVRETFHPSTDHGGEDGDGRSMRYMEWTFDPDPNDDEYVTEYVYMLREGDQPTRVVHDRHLHGIFSRDVWKELLHAAGFETTVYNDQFGRDLFLCQRRVK